MSDKLRLASKIRNMLKKLCTDRHALDKLLRNILHRNGKWSNCSYTFIYATCMQVNDFFMVPNLKLRFYSGIAAAVAF